MNKTQLAPDDIINFITEEAENHVIEDNWVKQGESALSAHTSKIRKPCKHYESGGLKRPTCENCGKEGYNKENCWAEGGGEEKKCSYKSKLKLGKGKKKEEEPEKSAAQMTGSYLHLHAPLIIVAESLKIPRSKLGVIVDSGGNQHYCPNCSKFLNYCEINNHTIKSADECTFKVIDMGDVHIDLLNGSQPKHCSRTWCMHPTWHSP